jgi:hypothetical protein
LLLIRTQRFFSTDIHVFLHITGIGQFGTKCPFVHLENYDLQKVYLSTANTILTGNNVLDAASSNLAGLFGEIHVFLQLS